MSNESIARAAAEEFRTQYSLGTAPIADVAQLIEHTVNAGVAIIAAPDGAKGHGMTMQLDGSTLVAAGATPHPMRLRSTLAHELAHIVLSTVDQETGTLGWDARDPAEIQADAFSRHLLLPLAAVRAAATGRTVNEEFLSDVVQSYMTSPAIAAIQLREAQLIDSQVCEQWRRLSAPTLAARFGWSATYTALAEMSMTPKGPQRLTARAVRAYQWGVGSPAMIARLNGEDSATGAADRLRAEGITPFELEMEQVDAPPVTGPRLTPEEIAMMAGEDH